MHGTTIKKISFRMFEELDPKIKSPVTECDVVGLDHNGPGDERGIIYPFNVGCSLFELNLLTRCGRAKEYFISETKYLFFSYRTFSNSLTLLSHCYLKTS
jgi:hypothetical protein